MLVSDKEKLLGKEKEMRRIEKEGESRKGRRDFKSFPRKTSHRLPKRLKSKKIRRKITKRERRKRREQAI